MSRAFTREDDNEDNPLANIAERPVSGHADVQVRVVSR